MDRVQDEKDEEFSVDEPVASMINTGAASINKPLPKLDPQLKPSRPSIQEMRSLVKEP